MQLLQLQNDISTIDHKHFCILVQGLYQKNSGGFIGSSPFKFGIFSDERTINYCIQ